MKELLQWKALGPNSKTYCLNIAKDIDVHNVLATIKIGKKFCKVVIKEGGIRRSPSGKYWFTSKLEEPIKKRFSTEKQCVAFVEEYYCEQIKKNGNQNQP